MPIYEYECRDCGGKFEKLVPRAGTPVVCEACGSTRVVKQFSVFAAAAPSRPDGCAHREECAHGRHCCHGGDCGCGH